MFDNILEFWFVEIDSAFWWKKDAAFDALIKDRFGAVHAQAAQCELYNWRVTPRGRLAEIIVLDQFSRNIYRNDARAFAADAIALALAQEAIACGADKALEGNEKSFLYMPFMHSESRAIHELAVTLFKDGGLENNLDFELKHKAIIDEFGRYPHRNKILGRASTQLEVEFLETSGAGF